MQASAARSVRNEDQQDRQRRHAAHDAVVLGSAVYDGRWLEPAMGYASEMADALRSRPTWLFSSGLSAGPLRLPDEVPDVRRLGGVLLARGHRAFGGRVERRLLSAAERQAWGVAAAVGDFRNWTAVRAWATEIAVEAAGVRTVAAVG